MKLDWTTQSPDQNPIESAGGFIKHKFHGKHTFTVKQLSRKIREAWSLFSEYEEKLVESMLKLERLDHTLGNCVSFRKTYFLAIIDFFKI